MAIDCTDKCDIRIIALEVKGVDTNLVLGGAGDRIIKVRLSLARANNSVTP